METQNLKRGIDLNNRLWEGKLAKNFKKYFNWWEGERLNEMSMLFILILVAVNVFMVYPIYQVNITPAFSSYFLLILGDFIHNLGLIQKNEFFLFLTLSSLFLAPISLYLFVRSIVLKYELIAFITVILFIIPSPFFRNDLALVSTILDGDGAHTVAFSFAPLVLIYAEKFISTKSFTSLSISALGFGLIALISPFTFFNTLVFLLILSVGNGFLGEMRDKFLRVGYLIGLSLGVTFFWYFPIFFTKIMLIEHVAFTFKKIWSLLPLAIPVIPILGTIFFLLFDRREKLRPIFVAIALFIVYFVLYTISRDVQISGLFTPQRYLIEVSFATSYLLALISVLLGELLIRQFISKIKNYLYMQISLLIFCLLVFLAAVSGFINALMARSQIALSSVVVSYTVGIGSVDQDFDLKNIKTFFAILVSVATLAYLIWMLIKNITWGFKIRPVKNFQ